MPLARLTHPRGVLTAIALLITAGLGTASAQTVIVRSAPPGSAIELTLNGGSAVTATADASGDATLAVPARTETDVLVRVDLCGNRVKALLVENGRQTPDPEPGCTRKDLWGVYIMRPVTTFVIDVDGDNTTAHVRQGPPPPEWIRRGPPEAYAYPWGKPSKGLALSAGTGLSTFSRATAAACGDVVCNDDTLGGSVTLSAEYWITPALAVQIGYLKPADATADFTGDTYRFDTVVRTRIFTLGAKAGVTTGPARIYGLGGLNRHEATLRTTETINDQTVVVDNVNRTLAGGTLTFEQKTTGWSWTAGGGAELWVARFAALYGEFYRAKIKGNPVGGGVGATDDIASVVLVGARVRIGRY